MNINLCSDYITVKTRKQKKILIFAFRRLAFCGRLLGNQFLKHRSIQFKMKLLLSFLSLLAFANGQCCMGGTLCPAGCCPMADWFCCENNWQCAA